jgi:non-lysosomal glucosylceramidase
MWAKPAPPASPQNFTSSSTNSDSPPFTYSGIHLSAINFPVGGFAAGNVKISGDGTLQHFSNVNQPKLSTVHIPNNFWGISATTKGTTDTQSFVLASPQTFTDHNCNLPQHEPAHVSRAAIERLQSLPGINGFTLTGKYPIANLDYDITNFPIQVSMEATSPCIPQDVKNSSLPCGYFTFTLTNPSETDSMDVRVMQSQQNYVGWDGVSDCSKNTNTKWGGNINTPSDEDGYSSMIMSNPTTPDGTLSLVGVKSNGTATTVLTSATDSNDIWEQFCSGKDVLPKSASASKPTAKTFSSCCGVVQSVTVAPSSSATVTFILTWHFPNRNRDTLGLAGAYLNILPPVLGNRYCDWFASSEDVSNYAVTNLNMLLSTTRLYTNTMYASTIPPELLDSASGRVACMRSATMWWTNAACSLKVGTNGTIMGTEGNGCCPLNCTHVYGYTTLMERLFPSLAKDMRYSDFLRNFDIKAGGCTMRFGQGGWAIDGALACIIKTYLVVRQSDGPELLFLKKVWPNVKEQMNYIQTNFDDQGDGVLRKPQQNTYDTAMNGANTFIGSYYVTALRCMSEMSKLMKEDPLIASEYLSLAVTSSANYEKICWNDSFGYYTADVTLANCKYSYGPGCFVDQLCSVGLSSACGLGHVFNPVHEDQAHRSLHKYNVVVKPPFEDLQKHFFDGDVGITVCTYPNGKLGDGMQYETIVSTGFTSPNIAGMLLDRNVEQASTLALNIRTRQDGRSKFYVISLALFIRLTLSCSYLFLHQMHHHGMNQNVMHCIQDQWHILTYLIKHVV